MQAVFLLSATALFIPVIFHTALVQETDSLNRDAPGTALLAALTDCCGCCVRDIITDQVVVLAVPLLSITDLNLQGWGIQG